MTVVTICAAALAGIVAGLLTRPSPPSLLAAGALALVATWLARSQTLGRTLGLLACAAALGALRGSAPPFASVNALTAVSGALGPVRTAAQANIRAYLPEPQASLAAGVLLGGSGRLDASFKADLQRSGLGHLLAIDGFKQVVVAAAVGGLATHFVGPSLGLVPRLGAVVGYTLLSGAHPSAERAALMVTLAGLASLTGRIADPLTSLGIAVLLMAGWDPGVLMDLGLQLSLSATLGIVLLWPMLRRALRLYVLPRSLGEPIGLSLAVCMACLPVTLSVFDEVSLVSPLAHVLAMPLLPAVLLGGAGLAIAGSGPPVVASVAAWLTWLPTSVLVWVIHAFGGLPGAAVMTGRLSQPAAAVLALALLTWGIWHLPELRQLRLTWLSWRARHRPVLMPVACVGACLTATVALHLLRPDGQLHVEPLGLPRGQAVFIRGPTGATVLVVLGGASPTLLASRVAEHLAVWEHHLDSVVALDARAAAVLGPTLARYPSDRLVVASRIPLDVEVGGSQTVELGATDGQLVVVPLRSALTTSAARQGSAN
ncbi:MAG: ComEC/Rec2 family competence protein [Chloroflexi bacterium]|nr:ComEC/Rec2 family competence protein [Chloroflexota bacterium]